MVAVLRVLVYLWVLVYTYRVLPCHNVRINSGARARYLVRYTEYINYFAVYS